jgi:hypothetical protein
VNLSCTLVGALVGGTAGGCAGDHGAGGDSTWRKVTTIAQLVEKTGIDLRAAVAASRNGERADAAIAAASCTRTRARRDCPYATWQRYRLHAGLPSLGRQHECLCPGRMVGRAGRAVNGAVGESRLRACGLRLALRR